MARYTRTNITRSPRKGKIPGKELYTTVKYPDIPLSISDIYVYAEEGDRYDHLAQTYYGDSSMWWIISCANESLPQNSYYLPLGVQIRIPQNTGAIMTSFYKLNNRNEL